MACYLEGKINIRQVRKNKPGIFSEDTLEEIKRRFTVESARKSLYAGVEDFCELVSSAERFYVTRNIAEVARAYANALNLDGFFPGVKALARILLLNPAGEFGEQSFITPNIPYALLYLQSALENRS